MIHKIVGNDWYKLFLGLIGIFTFFGITGDKLIVFLMNHVWILYATGCSLIWGVIVFGWHKHKESKKDSIILTARLDGQFKKIDTQFRSVGESIKVLSKGISDTVDLVEKNQDDFNKRFEWLYKQISKDKK